ncbi:hypothetical protein MMC12_005161 [Toensbergia leucococca]|nr:hypothetical protein [Toensbergia leucococca]
MSNPNFLPNGAPIWEPEQMPPWDPEQMLLGVEGQGVGYDQLSVQVPAPSSIAASSGLPFSITPYPPHEAPLLRMPHLPAAVSADISGCLKSISGTHQVDIMSARRGSEQPKPLNPRNYWNIIDAAEVTVTNNLWHFIPDTFRSCTGTVRSQTGQTWRICGIGNVCLMLRGNRHITLENVVYVPEAPYNVFSPLPMHPGGPRLDSFGNEKIVRFFKEGFSEVLLASGSCLEEGQPFRLDVIPFFMNAKATAIINSMSIGPRENRGQSAANGRVPGQGMVPGIRRPGGSNPSRRRRVNASLTTVRDPLPPAPVNPNPSLPLDPSGQEFFAVPPLTMGMGGTPSFPSVVTARNSSFPYPEPAVDPAMVERLRVETEQAEAKGALYNFTSE